MHDQLSAGLAQFLDGLSPPDREHAQSLLLACPTIDVEAGAPRFPTGFPAQALHLVDDGFVILRATVGPAPRSVVTCEAGPGRMLLPPTPDEVLILDVRAAATTDEQPEQSSDSEVQEREQHPAIPAVAPSQRPRHE